MATSVTFKDHSDKVHDHMSDVKNRILKVWGFMAEGYAKLRCPWRTGNLRRSIANDQDDDSSYVGTDVEYALHVEVGTSRAGAQPYLKPAIADHIDEYVKVAERMLKSG